MTDNYNDEQWRARKVALITGISGQVRRALFSMHPIMPTHRSYLGWLLLGRVAAVEGLPSAWRHSTQQLIQYRSHRASLLRPGDAYRRRSVCQRARARSEHASLRCAASFQLHYGDMTDSACLMKLISQIHPTEVYHLAAQSHVKVRSVR